MACSVSDIVGTSLQQAPRSVCTMLKAGFSASTTFKEGTPPLGAGFSQRLNPGDKTMYHSVKGDLIKSILIKSPFTLSLCSKHF